jgi:hypothetical protein
MAVNIRLGISSLLISPISSFLSKELELKPSIEKVTLASANSPLPNTSLFSLTKL